MNVIFIDFDGCLKSWHDVNASIHGFEGTLYENAERRIAILADICATYNCKVVVSSANKDLIDEETMELEEGSDWIHFVFDMFAKYGIECIGRTPTVIRRTSKVSYLPVWKEDEIRLYLYRHPEIKHYCVIDDDDTKNMLHWPTSDLDKVRNHLVTPLYYSEENPEETGLLEKHKEEVGKKLQEENEIQRLILRRDRLKKRTDK